MEARAKEAATLYFRGDWPGALRLLEEPSSGGLSGTALGWRAILQRRLGRRQEALAAVQAALKLEAERAWLRALHGEILRELGGRRRGYAEIQRAVALDPECSFARDFLRGPEGRFEAWVYGCRGGAARSRGNLEAALPDLLKAVDLDPGCGWAWGWLGELHLRRGRPEEALGALDRAVGLFAEWPEAFAWRGEAHRLAGDHAEALRDLDCALALGYKQYDVYLSRGSARLALGDAEGHMRDLAQAVRAAPEVFREKAAELGEKAGARWIGGILKGLRRAQGLMERADAARARGSLGEASRLFRECLKADPGNAVACLRLSEIEAGLSRNDEALRRADEAVRLDPCALTYAKRAQLAQGQGYMEAALRDISVSLGLAPNVELYQWRARAFLGMRHYDLALKDIGSALELEPDHAEMHDLRAHVNLLLGRLPHAQQDLEGALRLSPRNAALHLRLAQILALRGRYAQAQESLEPIRRESPGWAHFAAGYIHCVQKRYDLAFAEFERAGSLGGPADSPLRVQSGFYGTVAKALSGVMGEKSSMEKRTQAKEAGRGEVKDKGRVYLCGLGVYPPQTATVEVLRGISECDVVFNNLPGLGISEFLGLFCANRRPVAFRYEQDAKLCADLVLSEVRPGRTVGFVTFGHPLLFGPLSHEIIARCGRLGIPCKAFGAVSSMDAVLAASGQVLGYSYGGFQLFETTGASILKEIASANPRLPVVVYFADGMGEQGLGHLVAALGRIYSRDHRCLLYGPKHELWETRQEGVTIRELAKIAHHKLAQGILFVPPK